MFLSIIFAQIIGFYFVLVSIGTLIHQQRYRKVTQEFYGTHSLVAISENLSLLFGIIILVTHHVWVLNWPIFITIIGWILVIRGLMAVFFPVLFMKYSKFLMDKKGFIFMAWLSLVVGIILLWIGFTQ
ncbi:MAG TPA: hypothetical protein VLE96_06510 [Chlamydiales bacterium]|nr:hypothetical protein [Chlamydiales bacterium]